MVFDAGDEFSENCAVVHATGRAHHFTEIAFHEARPRENDDHATVVGTVVCRSDEVTFLTAFGIDLCLGLFEHVFPLTASCNNLEIVQRSAFGGLVVREILGIASSGVRDAGVDALVDVFVLIFEE